MASRHPSLRARSAAQQGFSLLEVLIAMALLGGLLLGANTLFEQHLAQLRIRATAQQMQVFARGVEAFVKDHYDDLIAARASGSGGVLQPASASRPTVLTVQTLQTTPNPETGVISATRYLPEGFQNQNSYQQRLCALVLQPQPGELYTLIVTENGQLLQDGELAMLAASIGAQGGALYDKDRPRRIARGSLGKWEFNLDTDPVGKNFLQAPTDCAGQLGSNLNFSTGHPLMALWLAENHHGAFLQRSRQEFNAMNTDLRFKDDFIDHTDPDAPRLYGGASIQLSITRGLGDRCDTGPTASSTIHQHPGHRDDESEAEWNKPANNPKKVPLGTLARTAQGDLLVCQYDEVKKDNYWTRPLSAGRYAFKINTGWGGFDKNLGFIGIGYITGSNQFSGTLHCDPRTTAGGNFCGGAGNVNCINYRKVIVDPRPEGLGGGAKTAANQEQCAWYYGGGASQSIGGKDITDYHQIDVNKISVRNIERLL